MIDIFEDIETALTMQSLMVPTTTMGNESQPPLSPGPKSPELILKKSMRHRYLKQFIGRFMENDHQPHHSQQSQGLEHRGAGVESESNCNNTSSISEQLADMFKNPIKLSFQDLTYTLPAGAKSSAGKQILKGLTGFAIPGETCFVMGASGSGKTTLLNILSQRTRCLRAGKITGKVVVNDTMELTQEMFGKFGAYVM
jgi:ABC-type multidrug transport system fused ATPase/permease subunit